jgi:hypothetical protein
MFVERNVELVIDTTNTDGATPKPNTTTYKFRFVYSLCLQYKPKTPRDEKTEIFLEYYFYCTMFMNDNEAIQIRQTQFKFDIEIRKITTSFSL